MSRVTSGGAGTNDESTRDGARIPAGSAGVGRSFGVLRLGENFGLLFLLIALVGVFSILRPESFATAGNVNNIALTQAVTAVLALALIITLVGGNFDLSVGSTAVASSIVTAAFMSRYGWPLGGAAAVAIAIGLAVGVFNGLLITRAKFNSLIATLGTAAIIEALVQWYTSGLPIASGISTRLLDLGTTKVWALPIIALIALGAAAVVEYVLTQTPYGRKLAAIGSNPGAAELVGLRVQRLSLISFVLAGGLAAVAGVVMVAQQASAIPSASGVAVLLPALTVAFLGASAFRPGEFNVPGMLVALVLISVLVSGLTLMGVPGWVQPLSYGVALIAGVGITAAFRARRLAAER